MLLLLSDLLRTYCISITKVNNSSSYRPLHFLLRRDSRNNNNINSNSNRFLPVRQRAKASRHRARRSSDFPTLPRLTRGLLPAGACCRLPALLPLEVRRLAPGPPAVSRDEAPAWAVRRWEAGPARLLPLGRDIRPVEEDEGRALR